MLTIIIALWIAQDVELFSDVVVAVVDCGDVVVAVVIFAVIVAVVVLGVVVAVVVGLGVVSVGVLSTLALQEQPCPLTSTGRKKLSSVQFFPQCTHAW
jgi:hypothetical protein